MKALNRLELAVEILNNIKLRATKDYEKLPKGIKEVFTLNDYIEKVYENFIAIEKKGNE